MLLSSEIVSFPVAVWTNYSKFITEKELILLGHFQAIQKTGRVAWEEIAARMDYKSIAPIRKTLNKLQDAGCVVLNKYTVDATPFYNACATSLLIEPPTLAEKQPKAEYHLAKEVLIMFPKANIHALAGTIKKMNPKTVIIIYKMVVEIGRFVGNVNPNTIALILDDIDFPLADVAGMVQWMDSYNVFIADKYAKPKSNVNYGSINRQNWERWNDSGQPTTFANTEKDKIFTRI